jgi:hypothetical protein
MKELRLTNAKTGEKLSNFHSFTKGGLIIAGRAYRTIGGIEYPGEQRSDYLLRYRTGAFNLYTEAPDRVDVTDFFEGLEAGAWGKLPGIINRKKHISRQDCARQGKQKRRK